MNPHPSVYPPRLPIVWAIGQLLRFPGLRGLSQENGKEFFPLCDLLHYV